MSYVKGDGVRLYYEDDDFTDPWLAPVPVALLQHGFARSSHPKASKRRRSPVTQRSR